MTSYDPRSPNYEILPPLGSAGRRRPDDEVTFRDFIRDRNIRKLFGIVCAIAILGGVGWSLFFKPKHEHVAASPPVPTAATASGAAVLPQVAAAPPIAAVSPPIAAVNPQDAQIAALQRQLDELKRAAPQAGPPPEEHHGALFWPRHTKAANGDELAFGTGCQPWMVAGPLKEKCIREGKMPTYDNGAVLPPRPSADSPPQASREESSDQYAAAPPAPPPVYATPVPRTKVVATSHCREGLHLHNGLCIGQVRAWCPSSHSYFYPIVREEPIRGERTVEVPAAPQAPDAEPSDDDDNFDIEERHNPRRVIEAGYHQPHHDCPRGQYWSQSAWLGLGGCLYDHGDGR